MTLSNVGDSPALILFYVVDSPTLTLSHVEDSPVLILPYVGDSPILTLSHVGDSPSMTMSIVGDLYVKALFYIEYSSNFTKNLPQILHFYVGEANFLTDFKRISP